MVPTVFCLVLVSVSLVLADGANEIIPKLLIDNDGGADDAFGLFMALLYEKNYNGPELVGISTVKGNVNESQAYINTQRVLTVADRLDVPIFRGSAESLVQDHASDGYFGKDGFGDLENVTYQSVKAEPIHAALAMIELSRQFEGQLIIITLGPLTNIALAARLDPGFIKRTKQIYVGAGHIPDSDVKLSLKPEFNVLLDVEAYYILAKKATPDKVTVIPFSQIIKSIPSFTTDWRINKLGRLPTRIIKALNQYERIVLPKSDHWQMLDPAVVASALNNSLITNVKLTENSVILCQDETNSRGTTTNNFETQRGNMKLVDSIDEDMYKKFLLDVFSETKTLNKPNCLNCKK